MNSVGNSEKWVHKIQERRVEPLLPFDTSPLAPCALSPDLKSAIGAESFSLSSSREDSSQAGLQGVYDIFSNSFQQLYKN